METKGRGEESGTVARQIVSPPRMTGRLFLLRLARVLVFASIAGIVISLAVRISGLAFLQVGFYLFIVFLLFDWYLDCIQSTEIILTNQELRFEKETDSEEKQETRIPLSEIVAIRRHAAGEDLKVTYPYITYAQRAMMPSAYTRLVWAAGCLSARLARLMAAERFYRIDGNLIVYREMTEKKAYLIPADEQFLSALSVALPEQTGKDDRMEGQPVISMRGRILQRAFPQLYPHVLPLLREEAPEEPVHKRKNQNRIKDRKNGAAGRRRKSMPGR